MSSSLSKSAIGEPQKDISRTNEPVWSDGTEEATKKEALHLISNGRWSLSTTKMGVERKFEFKTFARTMTFINSIAEQCKVKKHHPEWANVYNKVVIRWTTHKPEGLSHKDVEMAKFCDEKGKELGEADRGKLEMASAGGSLDTLLGEGVRECGPCSKTSE